MTELAKKYIIYYNNCQIGQIRSIEPYENSRGRCVASNPTRTLGVS